MNFPGTQKAKKAKKSKKKHKKAKKSKKKQTQAKTTKPKQRSQNIDQYKQRSSFSDNMLFLLFLLFSFPLGSPGLCCHLDPSLVLLFLLFMLFFCFLERGLPPLGGLPTLGPSLVLLFLLPSSVLLPAARFIQIKDRARRKRRPRFYLVFDDQPRALYK